MAVGSLAEGTAKSLNLTAKPRVRPVGGVTFSLIIAPSVTGLISHTGKSASWQLSAAASGDVVERIKKLYTFSCDFIRFDVRESGALLLFLSSGW